MESIVPEQIASSAPAVKSKPLTVTTSDGFQLAATLYAPEAPAKGGVIINSATAVLQHYYRSFAEFLVKQDYVVLTYDYRGIGGSAKPPANWGKTLKMSDWGAEDFSAIIDYATDHFAHLKWHCVGHSVGGQILGMAENINALNKIYCVASQSGYWKHWAGKYKAKMWLIWHLLIPVCHRALGKVPKVFIGGTDLPGSIARQWARWGRHPQYILSHSEETLAGGFEKVKNPIKFVAIEDDTGLAPQSAVLAMHNMYTGADRSYEVITKDLADGRAIGHFGFFRRHFEDNLWGKPIAWFHQDI